MVGISTSYPLKSPSTEWSWIAIDQWRNARKLLHAFLKYCKSGNFHVEIIHVVNIHVDLFSWVYGTHGNIIT